MYLQIYLKTFDTNELKYMNLTLLFLFKPVLAWQATLRNTKVNLELLINIDMLLLVEKVLEVE